MGATNTLVMHRAAKPQAASLRIYLNALSLELAACQTVAEVRAVKQAIQVAEFALTALGAS